MFFSVFISLYDKESFPLFKSYVKMFYLLIYPTAGNLFFIILYFYLSVIYYRMMLQRKGLYNGFERDAG